jgi:CheY-like chemotaxis protein
MFHVQLVPLGPNYSDGDDPGPIPVTHFPFVVGRNPDSDHRINDPMISRRHCAISVRDGRVWVEDLGSRNGTRLNGEPLTEARPLGDGDRLDLYYLPFQVRLVGAAAAAVAPEAADPGRAPAVGSRQVLVVEDDDMAAAALARLLQSWGCSVRVAHDGAEAIRAAREEPPDTVLLDIRLPGMSGVEVARRLRRDAGLERARLVAVTGDEGVADVLRSPEKFAQLLVKPVSASAVRDALGQPA